MARTAVLVAAVVIGGTLVVAPRAKAAVAPASPAIPGFEPDPGVSADLLDVVRSAFEDALRLGPIRCPAVRVEIADVTRSQANWDTCTISFSRADAGNRAAWWFAYVARHELAHLLTPHHGHDVVFRAVEARMLAPLGMRLRYGPAGEYPLRYETSDGTLLALGDGCQSCLVTIRKASSL